ncbi:MAG: protein serine/threonine phosphatase [Bacteroidetes bacterium]|nr:protein serine/threonine phosphatase [Bacteroidota bacterium]
MEKNSNSREEEIRSIDELNDMIWNIRGTAIVTDSDPMRMGREALEKCIVLNYTYGQARTLLNMGMGAFIILHDAPLSIKQLNESITLFTELGDKKWIANARLTLAIIYNSISQHEPAMYNALKGVDFYENDTADDMDKTMAFYVMGTVFKDLKKYVESEKYYRKGLHTGFVNSSSWGGRIYTSLANIYTEQGKYDDAILMSEKSLEVLREQKNLIGESRALTDLGQIYKRKKNYDQALNYFFQGLKLREESNLKQFAFSSLTEISSVYKETDKKELAIDYLQKAVALAIEINQPAKEAQIYNELGLIYKSLGKFKEALDCIEKYLAITISLHQHEKEAKIDTLQNNLLLEKEQEIERLRNVELKEAYNLITEKNKEITDSIHYAQRIQKALLAPDYILDQNLKDYFILYKPKDIVSGDFYWATYSNGLFFIAVCDSTGHGVPGAFMSLLNTTYLNEAINEKNITEPHLIFNHVRERLINAISQDGARDGMDGTLVCFNKKSGAITYAAANNGPIVRINNKMVMLPADKMPVGKDEKRDSFTLHTLDVKEGDFLYLVTDGYSDQFGGSKGKKFKSKQLEEVLQALSDVPLKTQLDVLDKKFEEWKGALEQVDDVLLIGIKI